MKVRGTHLKPSARQEALARFINRFTGEHVPSWAKRPMPSGRPYAVQFKDDEDWLANTFFVVTKSGDLDRRYSFCESSPTWPFGQ